MVDEHMISDRCKNCKKTSKDWQRCYHDGYINLHCWHEIVLKAKVEKQRYKRGF